MSTTESIYQLSINTDGSVMDKDNPGFNGVEYSRFKYGSRKQAKRFGLQLVSKIVPILECLELDRIVVTSSAYKCAPTASAALTKFFVEGLNHFFFGNAHSDIAVAKIDKSEVTPGDYGILSAEKRSQRMKKGVYHIDPHLITDKHILVVDDIRITGAHEQKIEELFAEFPFLSLAFLYIASFDESQALADPQVEDRLNHVAIKNLNDLLEIIEADDCIINARICKFILAAEPSALQDFLQHISRKQDSFVDSLYKATIGDGYNRMNIYKQQAQLVAAEALRRGLPSFT